MAFVGHESQRRCVGCGRVAPKATLRRLGLNGDRVVVDQTASLAGRGAYVCGAACASEAVRKRALGRAFRRGVTVDAHLVESIGT